MGVEAWATRGTTGGEPSADSVRSIADIVKEAPFVSAHVRPGLWRWNPQGLREEIAFCRAIGARTLVLHRESLGLETPSSRPDFPEIVRLARAARDAGVLLALENGWDSLWALDAVLDALGNNPRKSNLGICIDVGHAHLSQDAGRQPVRNYLERYQGALVHLHLHDNAGGLDDHRLPGQGTIDWSALLETLEDVGYNGPAVLELHPSGDPVAAIEAARTFLAAIR
jgi:sugar phosphate isomerase/epimerase